MDKHRAGAENFAGAIRSPYRAAADIATIVRRHNANYFRTLAELAGEMLWALSSGACQRNARRLCEERIRQREAFGAVESGITNAHPDLRT